MVQRSQAVDGQGRLSRFRHRDSAPYPHRARIKVLQHRWVDERAFGCITRWRRLLRDYQQRIDVSEAMIHVAMVSLLLRRISH